MKGGAQALDGGGFFHERGPPESRAHARTMRLTRGPSASAASPQSPRFRHLPSSKEPNSAQDGRGIVFIISRYYLNIAVLTFLCRLSRLLAAIAAGPLIFSLFLQQLPSAHLRYPTGTPPPPFQLSGPPRSSLAGNARRNTHGESLCRPCRATADVHVPYITRACVSAMA